MTRIPCFGLLCCTFLLACCGTAEHGLSDGYYKLKSAAAAPQKVYVTVEENAITLYPFSDERNKEADTTRARVISRDPAIPGDVPLPLWLTKKGIDFDISTVLFKYRFSTNTLPNQLNSNLNAAVYAGYRIDFFNLYERVNPLKRKEKRLRHFEVDAGLFAGIGSVAINPFVTNNRLDVEYDGLVLQKGAALFLGSGNFTLGIGAGADGLLDKNKSLWVYHEKWWLGLLVGINISG